MVSYIRAMCSVCVFVLAVCLICCEWWGHLCYVIFCASIQRVIQMCFSRRSGEFFLKVTLKLVLFLFSWCCVRL